LEKNQSDSDREYYLSAVKRALDSSNGFANFKRDPDYQRVLEHVTRSQGRDYLQIVKNERPEFLDKQQWKKNDKIGNPIKYKYDDVGYVSPTTLRYLKVASDLYTYFGEDIGKNIAEIGGGYGGQALILDTLHNFREYRIFDIPEVNELIAKYLESYLLNGSYSVTTLNNSTKQDYDLVISNYAFSELPSDIQRMYINKILANSDRGYLTMNSGKGGKRSEGKLSVEELENLLPQFEIHEEIPKTAEHNYIIVWDNS
jgi:putative sugar O-methyltransferase